MNNLQKLTAITPALGKALGVQFDVQRTGDPRWVRVFMMIPQPSGTPLSIGRLSYHDEELYTYKFYTDKWMGDHIPLRAEDLTISRILWYARTGEILSHLLYLRIIELVELDIQTDLLDKISHRRKNPKKGRRKLVGRDPRVLLRDYIMGRRELGNAALGDNPVTHLSLYKAEERLAAGTPDLSKVAHRNQKREPKPVHTPETVNSGYRKRKFGPSGYTTINIGDGEFVVSCNDCGAHVLNGNASEVEHHKTCAIPDPQWFADEEEEA